MSYQVGVDVGGSFTTAAVIREGRAEVVKIVPSWLPGVPRGFLRRVGDDTPVLVGARPVPAEALVAQLVRQVVSGLGTPSRLALTHPVTWGPHRVAALRAALGEVTMLSTAAAVAYRAEAPAAVHDLGGTTFTAAVVGGLATVGQPLELDLGGADLDELVFNHVRAAMGDELPTDPAELARLRQACTVAKEALSADTEVEIPVADTRVRLTRAEFEDMARPLLTETAAALRLTIEESGVTPASVLLAGGAAWLPLLTQVVSEELGRPVTATPPGAAAMGAALAAAGVPAAFAPRAARPANPVRPSSIPGGDSPTRLTPSLEPLPANGFVEPTALVAPVRPPVPTPAAPPAATSRKPRTMIAVAAASVVAAGTVGAILLMSGQTPAGAGADTRPPTTTVTETVSVTTTTEAPPPAETTERQAPQTPKNTSRPKTTTTTKSAPTTTTTNKTTTTTTSPTTTTTTTNTPLSRGTETAGGGDR